MADKVTRSITVQGEASEIFTMWSNFESFPNFMQHIKSVSVKEDGTSHWVMDGPLGRSIEWEAVTTEVDPNTQIAWRSTGGDIKTSGRVTFNQLSHGETEITATVQYVPPAGKAGEIIARFFENPDEMLAEDLRNFKKYAEGTYNPHLIRGSS